MAPVSKMAKASRDKSSLGNLMLKEGLVDDNELAELLVEFNEQTVEELLGQFLVRKEVLTPEKLELLLIRQEAARNGGVERQHVQRAMKIATATSLKVANGVDELMSSTQVAMAKVSEAK
jgi:hypothetical protein